MKIIYVRLFVKYFLKLFYCLENDLFVFILRFVIQLFYSKIELCVFRLDNYSLILLRIQIESIKIYVAIIFSFDFHYYLMITCHIRTKILDICNFLLQHLSLLKNLFLDWPDQDCLQVFLMVYGFQVFIFVERFKQAKKLFFISFQYFKYSIKDKK